MRGSSAAVLGCFLSVVALLLVAHGHPSSDRCATSTCSAPSRRPNGCFASVLQTAHEGRDTSGPFSPGDLNLYPPEVDRLRIREIGIPHVVGMLQPASRSAPIRPAERSCSRSKAAETPAGFGEPLQAALQFHGLQSDCLPRSLPTPPGAGIPVRAPSSCRRASAMVRCIRSKSRDSP